jgi:hypothetical protein
MCDPGDVIWAMCDSKVARDGSVLTVVSVEHAIDPCKRKRSNGPVFVSEAITWQLPQVGQTRSNRTCAGERRATSFRHPPFLAA